MYHLYVFGSKKEKNRNRDPSTVKNPSKKKRKKKEEKTNGGCKKQVDTSEVLCDDCTINAA